MSELQHNDPEKDKIEELDFTYFEGKETIEFLDKLKGHQTKVTIAFKGFVAKMGTEAKETKEASKVVVKFLREGKVTKEEEHELRTQVYDLLKMLGIGIPFFMIPGSTILLPFLIKVAEKKGVNLLPTAFTNIEEDQKEGEGDPEKKAED